MIDDLLDFARSRLGGGFPIQRRRVDLGELCAQAVDEFLEMHNPGAPIPPEVLPHVFEPGRRGDARAGGLGLGLFIVRQVVLAHGGRIEARSGEADGTVFTVTLPRKARHKV
jgi:signal transduction histidine kinase